MPPIVEVGCDHGHIAAALGAIATERERHRLPDRADVRRVVADGLKAFSRIGTVVIAGMGAGAIAAILENGPRPDFAVLHATDHPERLRRWCAAHGYRIDAERLAPENDRFAEIIRVVPGEEPATGQLLAFGPHLLEDPLVDAHIAERLARWRALRDRVDGLDVPIRAEAEGWIAFLEVLTARRAGGTPSPW